MKGRAGICSVCHHPRRREMEIGLCVLIPLNTLAARYDVSRDSLHRHKRDHLTVTQKAAILSAMKPSSIDLEALQSGRHEGGNRGRACHYRHARTDQQAARHAGSAP